MLCEQLLSFFLLFIIFQCRRLAPCVCIVRWTLKCLIQKKNQYKSGCFPLYLLSEGPFVRKSPCFWGLRYTACMRPNDSFSEGAICALFKQYYIMGALSCKTVQYHHKCKNLKAALPNYKFENMNILSMARHNISIILNHICGLEVLKTTCFLFCFRKKNPGQHTITIKYTKH